MSRRVWRTKLCDSDRRTLDNFVNYSCCIAVKKKKKVFKKQNKNLYGHTACRETNFSVFSELRVYITKRGIFVSVARWVHIYIYIYIYVREKGAIDKDWEANYLHVFGSNIIIIEDKCQSPAKMHIFIKIVKVFDCVWIYLREGKE